MQLLDFYRHHFGNAVKQQGSGWNGPCPLCGGEPGKSDRFMVCGRIGMRIWARPARDSALRACGRAASAALNRGKPDAAAHPRLMDAARVCVALDYDAPGAEGVEFWTNTYSTARRWPTPEGKNPGDAFRLGVDMWAWIAAGLPACTALPDRISMESSAHPHGASIAHTGATMQDDNENGHLDMCVAGLDPLGGGGNPEILNGCATVGEQKMGEEGMPLAEAPEQILVMIIEEDLSKAQQIAIQLSHNALVGDDDPTIAPPTLCPIPHPVASDRVRISAGVPSWMSPLVAAALREAKTVRFRFSPGERRIVRRRRPIPVSEWAEQHRVLEMSSIPGRWKNIFTPYLVGIMDAAGTPGVETVIVCKSPQTGGSEAGHNLVGWCIDRSPGPVMYVFPDEITARENAKDRIIPMITASPRLRTTMTGNGDDASSLRVNLTHMPIYLGWSGSVSRLGNKPIRTLILDELDKYKNPKNEPTSENLAEKRTTTWRTRRHILKISTPTTENGPIWTALTQEAGARFDYWVRCPLCGFQQLMDFERIGWPHKDTEEEPTAETVLSKRLAYYPCEHCGAVWDDGDPAIYPGPAGIFSGHEGQ